jgi:large subunit ribosomal protein L6
MSRLGKQPITMPAGVEASFVDGVLTVKGGKGTLSYPMRADVAFTIEGSIITLLPTNEDKLARALFGTYAAIVRNMVTGVSQGFTRVMQIEGVGYRAEAAGQKLTLNLGFSHPVIMEVPAGITAVVEKNLITLTGIDKEALGQFAANIRKVRKPEPYKGKGIRYQGEHIIRKQGKKAS